MKIENITKKLKYVNPEDIPVNSFFYDELGKNLYYLMLSDNDYMLFSFNFDGIRLEGKSADTSKNVIEKVVYDTTKLRLINDDDVKITCKIVGAVY